MTRRRRKQKSKQSKPAKSKPPETEASEDRLASDAPESIESETDSPESKAPEEDSSKEAAEEEVKAAPWREATTRKHWRAFPSPEKFDEPVRVAMTAKAYAEVVAHGKESLDAEVCGVLVGDLCEDDDGVWVSVKGAIRGTSAKKGTSHVTYTQETWEKIHEEKDRDFKRMSIVGWYHTHPGFGVEFSEMDLFIQRNFFSGESQFALVLDPLGGEEAICVNTPGGVKHAQRFCVDRRIRKCEVPSPPSSEQATEAADEGDTSGAAVSDDVAKRLQKVEERLQQVLQATDEERAARHRVRLTVGMIVAVTIVLAITWFVSDLIFARHAPPKPPEKYTFGPYPVRIGDKNAYLGVRVISWELPPELHAKYVDRIRQDLEEEAKRRQEELEQQEQEEAESEEEE